MKLLENSEVEFNGIIYKARHILFKPFMIREILTGKKTETRRRIDGDGVNRYGKSGDLLYIKETYCKTHDILKEYMYKYDYKEQDLNKSYKWKSGLFMPRNAARYWLQIIEIKQDLLCNITEKDARAEGFKNRKEFINAWNKINPYNFFYEGLLKVWVIKFKVFYIKK